MLALGLASCATVPVESAKTMESWPTRFEAEVDTVTRYASRLPDRCSQREFSRLGEGIVFLTLPATVEVFWRVIACERVLTVTLDCDERDGTARCSPHEPWYPEPVSRHGDPALSGDWQHRFFAAALNEAQRLPGTGECAKGVAVRSVPGFKRTGEVELERCGVTTRVTVTCEGTPLACTAR